MITQPKVFWMLKNFYYLSDINNIYKIHIHLYILLSMGIIFLNYQRLRMITFNTIITHTLFIKKMKQQTKILFYFYYFYLAHRHWTYGVMWYFHVYIHCNVKIRLKIYITSNTYHFVKCTYFSEFFILTPRNNILSILDVYSERHKRKSTVLSVSHTSHACIWGYQVINFFINCSQQYS